MEIHLLKEIALPFFSRAAIFSLLWRNGRSYDHVSWSRASADESLYYYGL